MRAISVRLAVVLMLCGAFVVSCSDSNDVAGDPPIIPESSTMDIDISDLQVQRKSAVSQTDSASFRARFTATLLGGVLQVNHIPAGILGAAKNAEPEYMGDGEWNWSFTPQQVGGSALLVANTGREEVTWSLYFTFDQQGTQQFLFFSGTSTYDGKDGVWNIHNIQNGDVVASSNWEITEDLFSLDMNFYEDGNNNPTATISYEFDGEIKTISLFQAEENSTVIVEWDVDTKVGFIIAPGFNNGEIACWDEQFQDIECPPVAIE